MNRKKGDNYIDVKNGIAHLDSNPKSITDTIFAKISQLNWNKLSDCECDDKYQITIDSEGKVNKVAVVTLFDSETENQKFAKYHKWCIKKFKRQLRDLQFDIIRWNDKPYQETIAFDIFYTTER